MSSHHQVVIIQTKTVDIDKDKYTNLNSNTKQLFSTKLEIIRSISEIKAQPIKKSNDLKLENTVISVRTKLLIVLVLFGIYLIYRIFFESLDNFEKVQDSYPIAKRCFYDHWTLKITGPINLYLTENLILKDILYNFTANLMDILLISFILYYVIYSDCARTLLTIFAFYFLRSNIQNNFVLSFYENYLYYSMEGFSFVVPNGRTADFFFSGHCGSAFIITLSFRDKDVNLFYYFGIFVILAQLFFLTSARAHYSVDVIFGIIVGHYLYIIVGRFLENVFPRVKVILDKISSFLKKLIVC